MHMMATMVNILSSYKLSRLKEMGNFSNYARNFEVSRATLASSTGGIIGLNKIMHLIPSYE